MKKSSTCIRKLWTIPIIGFLLLSIPIVGAFINIVQLTENSYNDWSPQIYDGQVTWYGYGGSDGGGDSEIFLIGAPVYTFSGVLQPINQDGSSLFKQGRTIPVKFRLTDDEGTFVDTAYATLEISMIIDDVTGEYEEVSSTSNADTGDVFRVSENQYIYNLSTKDLVEGTYLLRISLDDGQVFEVQIRLR